MAHFARVKNGIVTSVIVIEQATLDAKGGWHCTETGEFADSSEWIQTSYNTHAGVHTGGGTPLRKNFAGVGYIYDEVRDAFIPPQPFPSWTLNENTCQYEPPIPMPEVDLNTHTVNWDEELGDWVTNLRS